MNKHGLTGWEQEHLAALRVSTMGYGPPTFYGRDCGWTLARAHARSGDPVAIAAHLGHSDAFNRSITDFAERYADQNEEDFEVFVKAVRSGRWKRSKASRVSRTSASASASGTMRSSSAKV